MGRWGGREGVASRLALDIFGFQFSFVLCFLFSLLLFIVRSFARFFLSLHSLGLLVLVLITSHRISLIARSKRVSLSSICFSLSHSSLSVFNSSTFHTSHCLSFFRSFFYQSIDRLSVKLLSRERKGREERS